jgi:ribosomal protein S18 acetylase RimI-like enzyme
MSDAIRIEPYRPGDRAHVAACVEGIQEHERQFYPELRPASELKAYARWMLRKAAERNGVVLMARAGDRTIGFICGWIREDDKLLVKPEALSHAYVSDLFVAADWRRHGVAHMLLARFEAEMAARGCRRVQIGSRGANAGALRCYEDFGFRSK